MHTSPGAIFCHNKLVQCSAAPLNIEPLMRDHRATRNAEDISCAYAMYVCRHFMPCSGAPQTFQPFPASQLVKLKRNYRVHHNSPIRSSQAKLPCTSLLARILCDTKLHYRYGIIVAQICSVAPQRAQQRALLVTGPTIKKQKDTILDLTIRTNGTIGMDSGACMTLRCHVSVVL